MSDTLTFPPAFRDRRDEKMAEAAAVPAHIRHGQTVEAIAAGPEGRENHEVGY